MTDTLGEATEPQDQQPSTGSQVVGAAASIAKGSATGGLTGGLTAAGKAAVSSKLFRKVAAASLVLLLMPGLVLVSLFMAPTGVTGSNANQQVLSVNMAFEAGLTKEEVAVFTNPAYTTGLPWHMMAALYLTQKSGTSGVGPYQIAEDALGEDFTAESAADFRKATAWVSGQLRSHLRAQDRWMASTDIGIGGKLAAGGLVWYEPDASEDLVRTPYRAALSELPLAGASGSWADSIVDTAIHWRFGLPAGVVPCTSTYSGELPDDLSFEITPEQMGNAVIIVNAGRSAGVPERGWVVALMTALQESTLRNLTYGDRDSLGLFQQRPSTGWGAPEEILDAVKASQAFYGIATHTSNPGLVDIAGWESMPLGDAAQAVQGSAFPDAYAKWEPDARLLVAVITGTAPAPDARTVKLTGGGMSAPIMLSPAAGYDIGPVKPATQYLADDLGAKFDIETIYGWRPTDPFPDHPSGLAADFMVFEDRANGDALAQYAQDNAAAYGIKYLIWYQRYWDPSMPVGSWKPMEDRGGATANHMDHVHITVNEEGGTGTPAGTASSCLGKPFLSGLLARTDLSKGKGGDRTDELPGFVVQLDWEQLEPEQGAYDTSRIDSAITYAAEHSMRFRLRIRPGVHAPQWAKDLSAHGRPLPRFYDHDEHRNTDLPYLYDPEYQAAWAGLMSHLGTKYDAMSQVGEVNISAAAPMTAEWMLIFPDEMADNGKTNLANMQAAGFTEEDRVEAIRADALMMLTAWPTTPLTVWAHPYFKLTGGSSLSDTKSWIDELAAISPRFSFGNTGLDEHTVVTEDATFGIYKHIVEGDHPLTLQTRSIDGGHGEDGLGSLESIFTWAVEYGVMAIELPNGWQSQNPSPESITEANAGMAANAAKFLTGSSPGATISGDAANPLPAGSYTITSAFGPRPSPGGDGSTDHKGVDMGTGGTTPPIFAAAAGTVTFAGDCSCGYGLLVSIKVSDSIEMFYGHQSKVVVTTGQEVAVGQQIGVVGSTGASTGNHLHFEIRVDSVPMDPVPIMAAAGVSL